MSTPTLPPDTHSYQDAVTTGFYGRYVDDVPGDYYTVGGEGGGGGSPVGPPGLTSATPNSGPLAAAPGDVVLVGSGFNEPGLRCIIVSDANSATHEATSLTVASDTDATAHFTTGQAGAAAGPGTIGVYASDGGGYTNSVPWTWV